MTPETSVAIHFKDLETDLDLRDHLSERCQHLAAEFPETDQFELTLEGDAISVEAHAHVTGKKTRVAAHIKGADNPRAAGDQVLDKLERELRKEHDKRIFSPRRKAQKTRIKRTAE